MALSNQNSSEKKGNIRSNEYLTAFLYKKSQPSQNDCSGKNTQLQKNNILQEQTINQFQNKQENQIVTGIQTQENVANQFYLPKRRYKKSITQEKKSKTQPKLDENQENQQQTLKKVRTRSYHKIYRPLCVKIQIIQYNNNVQTIENYVSPEIAAQLLQKKIKQLKNEQKPIQQIQSNIFQSHSREIINKSSNNQVGVQECIEEDQNQKFSSYEMKMGLNDDPQLKEKQDILSQAYEILKQIPIKSDYKRHSILEDCLQLCLLFLPNIRIGEEQMHTLQFFQKIKQQYKLDRTHKAFLRRFYHLQIFSNCWTVQNLQRIYEIIKNSEMTQLKAFYLNYCILKKKIEFPSISFQKKLPSKSKAIEEIIANSQNKKIVLSLTTKTLCQYVNIGAKEIDEDIQEFDDELQFIEMILKLIPLVL